AVVITDKSLSIHLHNATVIDQFQFPAAVAGLPGIPATVSFDITYTKSGTPRQVQPTSTDPLSPFAWAGQMSMATNSGTFSVRYQDGSFAAAGSFSSAGNFGEMGQSGTARLSEMSWPRRDRRRVPSSRCKPATLTIKGTIVRACRRTRPRSRGGCH